jgi:hypothetical protein
MHKNLIGTCNEPFLLGSDAEIICKAAIVGTYQTEIATQKEEILL